jgi:hypothetical protein
VCGRPQHGLTMHPHPYDPRNGVWEHPWDTRREQRSEIRDQRSEIRDQRAEIREQRADSR